MLMRLGTIRNVPFQIVTLYNIFSTTKVTKSFSQRPSLQIICLLGLLINDTFHSPFLIDGR